MASSCKTRRTRTGSCLLMMKDMSNHQQDSFRQYDALSTHQFPSIHTHFLLPFPFLHFHHAACTAFLRGERCNILLSIRVIVPLRQLPTILIFYFIFFFFWRRCHPMETGVIGSRQREHMISTPIGLLTILIGSVFSVGSKHSITIHHL